MAAIVESVRRAGGLVDDGVDRDLVSPGIDVADEVLPRLLGAIDTSESLVLILDDYQLLSGAAAHDLVAALVEQMPGSAHVVIATRADPVLPLGRLRASGAMDEIRSDELRFDTDEVDRFLNGALGLALDPTSLDTLEERTEGWPAGLYLAALAMRSRRDRAAFVADVRRVEPPRRRLPQRRSAGRALARRSDVPAVDVDPQPPERTAL